MQLFFHEFICFKINSYQQLEGQLIVETHQWLDFVGGIKVVSDVVRSQPGYFQIHHCPYWNY